MGLRTPLLLISCGLCKEICPVDIDIPMMIAKVKSQEIALDGQLNLRESDRRLIATESSVCAMQSNDGLHARVMHPLYFVKPELVS